MSSCLRLRPGTLIAWACAAQVHSSAACYPGRARKTQHCSLLSRCNLCGLPTRMVDRPRAEHAPFQSAAVLRHATIK
eukprot:2208200-Amphidinium_carterae.1